MNDDFKDENDEEFSFSELIGEPKEIEPSEYAIFKKAEDEFEDFWGLGSPVKPDDDFESMEYLPGESKSNDRGYGM